MRIKRIVVSICALVAAVLTFVGSVFAVNYWYDVSGEVQNLLSVGATIRASINGATTTQGNYDTQIQPNSYVYSPAKVNDEIQYYSISIKNNQTGVEYDYFKNPSENVKNPGQLNVYLVINETTNTADTQFWRVICSTSSSIPGRPGKEDGQPYGTNHVQTMMALPTYNEQVNAEGKHYEKMLLFSNVGRGDLFYLVFHFSAAPALVETQRTLAYDLVLEVVYDEVELNS